MDKTQKTWLGILSFLPLLLSFIIAFLVIKNFVGLFGLALADAPAEVAGSYILKDYTVIILFAVFTNFLNLVQMIIFIILAVNQEHQMATGCSIDASVVFIQSLEQKYKVDLLDKMNVTFKVGEHVAHKTLIDFKKMAKDKAVTGDTIVFNNLVNNIAEFNESWETPAADSWHSRFF